MNNTQDADDFTEKMIEQVIDSLTDLPEISNRKDEVRAVIRIAAEVLTGTSSRAHFDAALAAFNQHGVLQLEACVSPNTLAATSSNISDAADCSVTVH